MSQHRRVLVKLRRQRLIRAIVTAGWILLGLGLWRSLVVFAEDWPAANSAGLVIFIAMLAVGVSGLGVYGRNAGNPLAADFARWLTARPWEKFLAGGLIAAYVIFVRKVLFDHVSTAYLIEWLLFCILSWRIFEGIKESLEKHYVSILQDNNWKKHVQIVDDLPDDDFNKIVILQEDFVAGGPRHEILQYISQVLARNGQNEEEAVRSLRPLIEHSDRKIPWYAFGWWKRRMIRQNREKRRRSIDETIKLLTSTVIQGR